MSSMTFGSKGRSWVVSVTILSIVLGVLLAASLKTTQRNIREFGGSTRVPRLVEKLRVQEQANKLLETEIIDLRKEVTNYQRKLTDGSAASEELLKQLQDAKVASGLTSVSGPGVVVTLKDSKEIPPPGSPMEVIMEYMVHDTDVRNIINELNNAGAEVIAVNGKRITARSAVRCSGNVTMVNNMPIAAPFVIAAIGDPDTLINALKIPRGPAEELAAFGMIEIHKAKSVKIKAFTGPTGFNFSKVVKEGS